MAVFGKFQALKGQILYKKFQKAFDYLSKTIEIDSPEHIRLINYPLGTFEKIDLDNNNFALEQVYMTKEEEFCFFESHRQYIDVQMIVDREEIIEVCNSDLLIISSPYNESKDLITYENSEYKTSIRLQKGDVAIFYPTDGHKPCIKINDSVRLVKTVVKVKI